MAKSNKELKSLLMKVKEESEKPDMGMTQRDVMGREVGGG